MGMSKECVPLFETTRAKGTTLYRVFAISILANICLILFYRVSYIPSENEYGKKWAWIGLLGAELWFSFYWILTQASRWNLVSRRTFKDRLSQSYEKDLPGVDIFVCTADPAIEPPMMVINTVLSVMAYDYPSKKLSVYLSDDAGSDITYYALLEASHFAKHWIPFCKKFKVEPRSPAAYFLSTSASNGATKNQEFFHIKKLYEDMKNRIETSHNLGRVPNDIHKKHVEFSQWNSYVSKSDHDTILQVLVDSKRAEATDNEGKPMPTLVYLAREKRSEYFHNFKAGAMNALIRVSSALSNGEVILNVDCDMYSNNSESIRDALCFFMDEEKGHEIAYVQFPQSFENTSKNEPYGSSLRVIREVEFPGLDGYGGVLYIGSGCFHRRETLCGKKFSRAEKITFKGESKNEPESTMQKLDEVKKLASCKFEEKTQWGKQVGLKYGCPVEDVITGLSIQCDGWKSVYFNPKRKAFFGVAPTTLLQTLVQHKRWSEGDFQILFSKYSPAWYGLGRIHPGLILGYLCYCLWAPNCIATVFYCIVPALYLLKGISIFPEITSPWSIQFAYVAFATHAYSLAEFLWSDGTLLGWWNEQRMWLYKRTSSYIFAFMDTFTKLIGFSETAFVITAKVADEGVSKRYQKEMMEFGASSPMFTILATLALLNLICFLSTLIKVAMSASGRIYSNMFLQFLHCAALVFINIPLYESLFIRKDKGRMPTATTVGSMVLALFACISFTFLW